MARSWAGSCHSLLTSVIGQSAGIGFARELPYLSPVKTTIVNVCCVCLSGKSKLPYHSHRELVPEIKIFISSARFGVGGMRSALGRHVKDKHVKDTAQNVEKDVAEDTSSTSGCVHVLPPVQHI